MSELITAGGSGDYDALMQSYDKNVAAGQAVAPNDFIMKISRYPDLGILVQTAQTPLIKREMIESYGQKGVKFWQWGKPILDGELSITLKEVVSGTVLAALQKMMMNREYVDVELRLASEGADTPDAHIFNMEHCVFNGDPADLDVSNVTGVMTVPVTMTYNRYVPNIK